MNTHHTHTLHDPVPTPAPRKNLASLGRFLVVALGIAMLALFLAPTASAGVDGKYKYVTASGKFSVAGETVKITRKDMKPILSNKAGNTVIKNSEIRFDVDEMDQLIQQAFEDSGGKLKITVTGPKSLKLRKSGKKYVGANNEPVVIKINGKISKQSVKGKFKFNFKPTVKGDKLTFNVPVRGSLMGFPITGKIRIVCER